MASLAAGEGARNYADKLISSNVDPDALFIVKDKSIVGGQSAQTGLREYDPDVGSQNGATIKLLTQADVDTLQARKDIQDVRPIYDASATYFTIEGFDKRYSNEVNDTKRQSKIKIITDCRCKHHHAIYNECIRLHSV